MITMNLIVCDGLTSHICHIKILIIDFIQQSDFNAIIEI